MADFSKDSQNTPANGIDGNPRTSWETYPRVRESHWAVFVLKSAARVEGGSLSITLDSGIDEWGKDGLGRFRLSVTNEADFTRMFVRNDLKDGEVVDVCVALGQAQAQQGRLSEAVALFTEALDLTKDRAAKAGIIAGVGPLQGVLQALAERAASDAQFQAELAQYYTVHGQAPLADAARARARTLFEDKLAKEPDNAALAADLFSAYQLAGRTREAIPLLAKASAGNPKDTVLSLQVAALQAWFGQDKELAATRQRILAFAKGTTDAGAAEHAAKSCSIRASTDKAELEAALALGRTGVNLYRGQWTLMSLGMAEYRSGNYPAADEALLAAVNLGQDNPHVPGTSAFYRAMTLFRQGKKDEARKLAIHAAAKMKPLPADEQNPLTGDAMYEDLILWLAYKEAKALIQFDAAPAPKAENDRNGSRSKAGVAPPGVPGKRQ
jgi:tetratricopeptide (TPR) repeat protein